MGGWVNLINAYVVLWDLFKVFNGQRSPEVGTYLNEECQIPRGKSPKKKCFILPYRVPNHNFSYGTARFLHIMKQVLK